MPDFIEDESFLIEVSKVVIPEGRHRSTFSDEKIQELANSIKAVGQIHPIVITRDNKLIVGECRLRARRLLGHDFIVARYADDRVQDKELKAVELIENLRRTDLSWQDTCRGVYDYHELMKEKEGWTLARLGAALSISPDHAGDMIAVHRASLEGNDLVQGASTFSAARGVLHREFSRAVDAELENLDYEQDEPLPNEAQHSAERRPKLEFRPAHKDIHQADFLQWDRPQGPRFNLIHCDFPYGISYDKSSTQSGAQHHGVYEDSKEAYWALCKRLIEGDFIAESAHILFWFSMHHYYPTVKLFLDAGFSINPFPLIWHKSDNTGLLPDPNRGPRRIYETALLMTKGDRKIVKPVNNIMDWPAQKSKAEHISEKPLPMVKYFLSMLVDSSTVLLDPTCGSGGAVVAADELGALRVTGLEIDKEHAANAQRRLSISRQGRAGGTAGSPPNEAGGGVPEKPRRGNTGADAGISIDDLLSDIDPLE